MSYSEENGQVVRWIGFPVRCLLYLVAVSLAAPIVIVLMPNEWNWDELREEWHRWVLQDRRWRVPYQAEVKKS
jgi:hypothetical protein